MKNKTVPVLYIVVVLLCLLTALVASQRTTQAKDQLNEERYQRMILEENFQKSSSIITVLKNELAVSREKLENIQTIINQGSVEKSSLQSQLEQMTKLKESLERDIENLKIVTPAPSTTDVLQEVSKP